MVPASPESLEHLAEAAQHETPRTEDLYDVEGFWVREGTGEALRYITWGGYSFLRPAAAGAEKTDRGTLAMRPDGRLTLTSNRDSRDCADGDLLVLGDVLYSEDQQRHASHRGAGQLQPVPRPDDDLGAAVTLMMRRPPCAWWAQHRLISRGRA